jgi:Arc/MetJ-type ribon-helix-helix transcriptional regulator
VPFERTLRETPPSPYTGAMRVAISPEREAWIRQEVAAGVVDSADHVVERALLACECHLDELRQAIAEADASLADGAGVTDDADGFKARMHRDHPRAK